jgi:PadR family transcriptional regulator PadR
MATASGGDLLRGNLDLMVLSVLVEDAAYGYKIQQRLRTASHGLVDLRAGTLYPLLHRLEDDRLIRSRWDDSTGRRRKWYTLTATGRRQLKCRARQWQEVAECLERLLAPVLGVAAEPA